jgi:hypothetical protein
MAASYAATAWPGTTMAPSTMKAWPFWLLSSTKTSRMPAPCPERREFFKSWRNPGSTARKRGQASHSAQRDHLSETREARPRYH